MVQQPIRCSVIINTYNREAFLRKLLPGLEQLIDVDFEVIVVNGPSTDSTLQFLAQYEGRIKIVTCPDRNLSRSRNIGIAQAAGDIIVFIDDDALPVDREWLKRFAAAFSIGSNEQIGAIGGPVLHRDTALFEFHGGATSDYGLQIFEQSNLENIIIDGKRWVNGIPGGNNAISRKAIIAIGGFDEFYTYYLDETDVCFRLARAGFIISYDHENGIRHYAARSSDPLNKFNRNWTIITRSDTYFSMRNGNDNLAIRFLKTLMYAPRKHFFQEIVGYWRKRELSFLRWINLIKQWGLGLWAGLWAGMRGPRQLASFQQPAPDFIPFRRSTQKPEQILRIALLTQTIPGQSGYGGIGRYTFDLAQGLHERGHEVHIFCRSEDKLYHHTLNFFIHGIGLADIAAPEPGISRPILDKNVRYSEAIVRKLATLYNQGIEFDVVHASNWDSEAAALIRTGAYPTVLMLVSPLAQVLQTEQWELTDDLEYCIALDRWQIEHADTICVPSEGVLSSYRTLMGIEPEDLRRLKRTPLGIVPTLNAPLAPNPASDRKILLFVGRCERRKGTHTLLKVLPELLQSHPDWECHIVGNDQIPTPDGSTLKEQFRSLHARQPWLERVQFVGMVSEAALQQHYQTCDLFVAPSLFESFGLIYHEAMQYGKAVIGCRTGGVPEVVEHGVDGLLVTPESPVELFDALKKLMDDEHLRTQMGQAGAQRIRENMNYRVMAAQLEAVYYETIAAVGEARKRRRAVVWPTPLPLFEQLSSLRFTGQWPIVEVFAGQYYRQGTADSRLEFTTKGGGVLHICTLRHAWSGVLEVRADDQLLTFFDLYYEFGTQPEYWVQVELPGTSHTDIQLLLRVHTERNPASEASEVWLKQLLLIYPEQELPQNIVSIPNET